MTDAKLDVLILILIKAACAVEICGSTECTLEAIAKVTDTSIAQVRSSLQRLADKRLIKIKQLKTKKQDTNKNKIEISLMNLM
jgi:hypothetical protein